MNKRQTGVFLLIVVLSIALFFFLQSDKKHLRKKTLKLVQMVSVSKPSDSALALLRRAQGITKHVHFSVEYQVKVGGYAYQNHTLNRLRSDLLSYFKQGSDYKARVEMPSKKELAVSFSEDRQKAKVQFSIPVSYKDKKILCSVLIHWEKEKSWLIHKIRACDLPEPETQ